MTSTELWARITSSPRPHKVVDFPRSGADGLPLARVAMIVLTQEEQIIASAETERYTKKAIRDLPKSDEVARGYNDIYNNRAAVEILFRSCRHQDEISKSFFPSPDEIQRALTVDEVGTLFRSYLIVQGELGPIPSSVSEEDRDAWVRRLQEAGDRRPLASLSWESLSALAFSMACQIESLSGPKSLPGNSPESGSSTSNEDEDAS